MKKCALTLMAALAVAFTATAAHADMTYAPFLFTAYDNEGLPIENGTYAMVLDLDGNGWNGLSYLAQSDSVPNDLSWLWDDNDLLMDRGAITDGSAYPFTVLSSNAIPADYSANEDEYYLLWFDVAFDPEADGPGAGVYYGAESLGTVGTDPGDYTPFAMGGNANLMTTAVPEPISALLMVLGAGLMGLKRRFNA